MLGIYDVPQDEQAAIVQLARDSRNPSFSTDYKKEISPQFATYLDYEAYASRMFNYQTKIIPGPAQQGGYADSVLRIFSDSDDAEDIQRRVNLRNRRAEGLLGPDGPQIDFVIDENALHRAIGGEESSRKNRYDAMIRLFEHLMKINTAAMEPADKVPGKNPAVAVRIVPFEYGAYRAFAGPFVLLDFDENEDEHLSFTDSARVYLEWPDGEEFTADKRKIVQYSGLRDELLRAIPSAAETADILRYIERSFESRIKEFPVDIKPRSIVPDEAG